jgi:hypothetical protein
MRERVEHLLPPPPTAAFVNATITIAYDGDRWKCVEYRGDATTQAIAAHYERAQRAMWWGANDGFGFDGPFLVQPAPSINARWTVTPWDQSTAAATPISKRISVCYEYEFERWPVRSTRPDHIVHWPNPEVSAWRERVEQAYPPDPSWTFSNATMIARSDGYRWDCVTYTTGQSAQDGRDYYRRWLPAGANARTAGPPYLLPARMSATDGTVTICPHS